MNSSWFFLTFVAGLTMVSCGNTDQPSEDESSVTENIWISYFYKKLDSEILLSIDYDGTYRGTNISERGDPTSAKTFRGKLDVEQRNSLAALVSEDRFAVYRSDELQSCEVDTDQPIVHEIMWKELVKPNYLVVAHGCLPDEPTSSESQEIVASLRSLAQRLADQAGKP